MNQTENPGKKKWIITKTVAVDYYYHIEAKTLAAAKRKMTIMEKEGDLSYPDNGYNWGQVLSLEVEESK